MNNCLPTPQSSTAGAAEMLPPVRTPALTRVITASKAHRFIVAEGYGEAERPCLQIIASQSALTRFLSKQHILTREITTHPECGWVATPVSRHNKKDGGEDAQYITADFDRILKEILDMRKKDKQNRLGGGGLK
ncbi:hypothetical protein C8R47DRAFT_1317153, partial [Mycena vitilis]